MLRSIFIFILISVIGFNFFNYVFAEYGKDNIITFETYDPTYSAKVEFKVIYDVEKHDRYGELYKINRIEARVKNILDNKVKVESLDLEIYCIGDFREINQMDIHKWYVFNIKQGITPNKNKDYLEVGKWYTLYNNDPKGKNGYFATGILDTVISGKATFNYKMNNTRKWSDTISFFKGANSISLGRGKIE